MKIIKYKRKFGRRKKKWLNLKYFNSVNSSFDEKSSNSLFFHQKSDDKKYEREKSATIFFLESVDHKYC